MCACAGWKRVARCTRRHAAKTGATDETEEAAAAKAAAAAATAAAKAAAAKAAAKAATAKAETEAKGGREGEGDGRRRDSRIGPLAQTHWHRFS